MISIEKIEETGSVDQLEYLKRNSNSLFYATPAYLEIISEYLSVSSGWLLSSRNGEISGVLPFLKQDGPLGPVFNSLAYFGSNGGVIQHKEDEESKRALIHRFYELAESENACSATIITNPLEQDWEFYEEHTGYDLKDQRIGQITHFPSSLDEADLDSIFQDPRPRNIRRALKEGIEVEKTHSEEAIDFLYNIHVKGMVAKGGTPKERAFFDLFPEILDKDDWAIYMARLHGEPVAALLLFYFNQTVEYFTPVIVYEQRKTQASSLVIFRAMQDAMVAGYKNWNWGGTWLSQKGVYNFKKKWNAEEYPYFYFVKIYNEKVMEQTPEYLLQQYPGFYLLPFSYLKKTNGGETNNE